jgi:hypothetical protein
MTDLFDDEDLKRAQAVVTHLTSHSGSGLPAAANLAIVAMFAALKIERSLREVVELVQAEKGDRADGEHRAQRPRKTEHAGRDGADA